MPGDMKAGLRKIRRLASRKISSILSPSLAIELSKLTPVPELLACNGPPTEDEIAVINTAIEATTILLATLEGAPQGDQSPSSQRNQKRIFVYKEFIRIHQSLLSPLRRLPMDLLSEIFIQSAYSKRGIYSTPPWALSQVCSEWRAVALDLPLLWNGIYICLAEKNKTHAALQFLSMRLDRSREAPLDLFVGTSVGYEYIQHPIIGLLTDHAERWRSVQFQMSGRTLQAFGDIKGRLHRLRSLDMSLLYGAFPEDTIYTFEVAPQLRVVSANGISMSTRLVLPWSQLVEYKDEVENNVNRDRAFTRSSSLESLHLTLKRPRPTLANIAPFPPTQLNKLSAFSISFPPNIPHHERLPEDLFEKVSLPSLVDIRIRNYYGSVDLVLKSLIKRSYASLKILELSSRIGRLAPGSLTSVLMLTAQLTDLVTTMPCQEDLANLVITDTQPILVPALQSLIFHVDRTSVDERLEKMMTDLAASRCEPSGTGAAVSSEPSTSQPTTASPLSIRLVFYDLNQCFSIHEKLEKLHRGPEPPILPSTEQIFTHLTSLGIQLRKDLPHVMSYISMAKRSRQFRKVLKPDHPGIKDISEELLQSLDEIGKYEKITVTGLYASSLHHLIWHISQVIENANLETHDLIHDWKRKADSVLEKWNKSYVIPDLANRRWAYQGFQSIVYTPTAHEIRQNPETALKMIYGIRFYEDKYGDDAAWFSRTPSNLQCRD